MIVKPQSATDRQPTHNREKSKRKSRDALLKIRDDKVYNYYGLKQ